MKFTDAYETNGEKERRRLPINMNNGIGVRDNGDARYGHRVFNMEGRAGMGASTKEAGKEFHPSEVIIVR